MPRFWVLSIASNAMILGIAALSLVFMAGYGGMTSLAQAALAGFAAYMLALATLEPSTNAVGSALGFALPSIPSAADRGRPGHARSVRCSVPSRRGPTASTS